ncbi:MAG: hypothetical protein JRI22_22955 [Deltaproteobacteria bacterium]|nr:hypothetical protein [Deltaproteobacteria bacterium]
MAENISGNIVNEQNRQVKFGKKTERTCPSCNASGNFEDRVLHIRSSLEESVTLECPRCMYTEHLPLSEVPEAQTRMTDIMGRPIK